MVHDRLVLNSYISDLQKIFTAASPCGTGCRISYILGYSMATSVSHKIAHCNRDRTAFGSGRRPCMVFPQA